MLGLAAGSAPSLGLEPGSMVLVGKSSPESPLGVIDGEGIAKDEGMYANADAVVNTVLTVVGGSGLDGPRLDI